MSINVLSMFAMVLVIGIVVDDAIVVVENVERIMADEKLPPLQATRKAMSQISGAVIGITVVLIAVFIPMAFSRGRREYLSAVFGGDGGVGCVLGVFGAVFDAGLVRDAAQTNHARAS